MNSLLQFIREFHRNQGLWVFAASFIQKISGFAATLIVIRLLSKDEFGLLSIVPAAFAIFAPFTGLGLPVALLRYGSLMQSKEEKENFSAALFREGFIFQLILSLLFVSTSVFFVQKYDDIFIIFLAFAVRLLGIFFMIHAQSTFRINFDNRSFAVFTIIISSVGLFLIAAGSYYFGFLGYLVAMAVSPFLSLFWFKKAIPNKDFKFIFSKKEVYSFSIHSAVTNLASELLFAADIILLSFLLTEDSVASYKVAILIPSNIIFFAQSFIQSDYPKITRNSHDKLYLKNYILQYFKLFVPLAIVCFILFYFLRFQIIEFFFSKKYLEISKMMLILMFFFLLSMFLRILFGNLLSAIGKMQYVTYGTVLAVILLGMSSLILVPHYHVLGMVYSMSFSLTCCGIYLALMFKFQWSKI